VEAADKMDWQQVVLNGGPPCFHIEDDGKFCGRAQRWDGHGLGNFHQFSSLKDLLTTLRAKRNAALSDANFYRSVAKSREAENAALREEIKSVRLASLLPGEVSDQNRERAEKAEERGNNLADKCQRAINYQIETQGKLEQAQAKAGPTEPTAFLICRKCSGLGTVMEDGFQKLCAVCDGDPKLTYETFVEYARQIDRDLRPNFIRTLERNKLEQAQAACAEMVSVITDMRETQKSLAKGSPSNQLRADELDIWLRQFNALSLTPGQPLLDELKRLRAAVSAVCATDYSDPVLLGRWLELHLPQLREALPPAKFSWAEKEI